MIFMKTQKSNKHIMKSKHTKQPKLLKYIIKIKYKPHCEL